MDQQVSVVFIYFKNISGSRVLSEPFNTKLSTSVLEESLSNCVRNMLTLASVWLIGQKQTWSPTETHKQEILGD